jgi:recombination protein RecA
MAKKKIVKKKESDRSTLHIDNFLIPAGQLEEKQGRIFPVCVGLDIALSGGIPEGTNVLLTGKPKVGKTTVALQYVQQCHRRDDSKQVFFFDVEGRLRSELLDCFPDINRDNFNIIRSNEERLLTAENYIDFIFESLRTHPKCIVIVDSVAALCPEAEMNQQVGESLKLATVATLMYKMFRKASQILAVNHSTLILLTHMVSNPSPMSKNTMTVGGNANQYGATVWLEFPWKENLEDTDKNTIGQLINTTVQASALGAPGAKLKLPLIYGEGVHELTDVFNHAVDFGLIEKAGSWYSYMPEGEEEAFKTQGAGSMVDHLAEHPEIAKYLESEIRKMTGCEIDESEITETAA